MRHITSQDQEEQNKYMGLTFMIVNVTGLGPLLWYRAGPPLGGDILTKCQGPLSPKGPLRTQNCDVAIGEGALHHRP